MKYSRALLGFTVIITSCLIIAGCNILLEPPDDLAIVSVSPNPFSDTLKIVYSVVSSDRFSRLRIYITDRDEQTIAMIVDTPPVNGVYTVTWRGQNITKGKTMNGGFYYLVMDGWANSEIISRVLLFKEGTL